MAPPVQLRCLITGVRVNQALPYFLTLQVGARDARPDRIKNRPPRLLRARPRRSEALAPPTSVSSPIPCPLHHPLTPLPPSARLASPSPAPLRAQTLKSRDSKPRDVTYGDDLALTREDRGQYARTETTEVTSSPEFQNRAFVLSVPRVAGGRDLHPNAVEDLLGGKDWPGDGTAAQGTALGDGPPTLCLSLYGARSAHHSAMGQDVLVGQGYVEFFGATVQRLRRGEAVSVNVSLEHPEGRAPCQLSLQITMLDTDMGAGGAVATRDGPGANRTLRVSVLVHSATGLSADAGADPAAFVAAKTMREAAARLPSRAATRAIPKSRDPTWDEVVSVDVTEEDLDREKVLLAVVNHDTNKLMAKAAVPLKPLRPGRHHSLALKLGAATLNITVVMPQAPARELAVLKANSDAVRVEGSLTGVSGDAGGGYAGPVTARWSMARDAAAARAAAAPGKLEVYHRCNGESESDVSAAIAKIAGGKDLDVVPTLQGSSLAGPPLWPVGHRAAFLTSQGAIAQGGALVLELFNSQGMIGRAVIPTADFGMGGRPTELNHVPLISAGGSASGASRGDEVGKVSVVARAWPREPLIKAREKQIAAGFDGGGGVGVGGEGAWMLSAMATDMIDKQQALDEAIVLLDRERKRTQQLKFRCDEASAAKQRLESDNAELRRLLHEERNADPAAGLEQLGLGGVNDVMEAKERLGQLAARYGQEKRRNAELIHRLKAMHESQASAEQLKGRHLELQEAHAEMSRYLQKLEREAGRVAKCRATIEMQEGIIARLEGLLEQSVVDQRRLAEAEAIASRVQDANTVLQAGPDWEELSMLRDEVKDLRTAYSEREQDHKDLQSERIALTLRAEKAEANAIASNNEMLDVSRKAAREIASLRAKLAEKDAQLMGGFGSVANMVLQEMPPPPRLTSMEPQPPKHAPATRARSPGILPDRTGSRRGAAGGVDGDGVGGVENRSRIGAAPGAGAGTGTEGPRSMSTGSSASLASSRAGSVAGGSRPGSVGGGSRPASRASAASAGSRPLTGDKPRTPDR